MKDPTLMQKVVEIYRDRVRNHPTCPSELKVALKQHPRMPKVMENCVMELNLNPQFQNEEDMKLIVHSATDLFILMLVQKATMTYRDEQQAKEEALRRKKEAESGIDSAGLDKFGNGFNEELGVTIRGTETTRETDKVQA